MNTAKRLPFPRLLLLLAPIIWASSNAVGKLSVDLLTPYQFTFYRWLLATLILSLVFKKQIQRDMPLLRARKWWLLCWGGSAFCLFNILLYTAFAYKAAVVNVAIVHSLIPMFVLVAGAIIYREKLHALQWIGVFVALFGVLWLLSRGQLGSLLRLTLSTADWLILISALIYAAYSLVLRNAPAVHWASLLWAMCLSALLVGLPFWLWELVHSGQLLKIAQPGAAEIGKALLLISYVAVFVAIVSKVFYMEGVIAIGAARAAMAMNLLPVFNALLGLLLFADERAMFGSVHIVAISCVVIGIACSETGAWQLKKARCRTANGRPNSSASA